jgi:hypothetical protein
MEKPDLNMIKEHSYKGHLFEITVNLTKNMVIIKQIGSIGYEVVSFSVDPKALFVTIHRQIKDAEKFIDKYIEEVVIKGKSIAQVMLEDDGFKVKE